MIITINRANSLQELIRILFLFLGTLGMSKEGEFNKRTGFLQILILENKHLWMKGWQRRREVEVIFILS